MSTSLLRDNTREPFVTIAIPTFNRASWLKNCVKAALSQTYKHFEVVVSDNASTDETQKVLQEFNDPRLRVIQQSTNIGLLPNWNACLAEAKGDYFVYCSDDDTLEPSILERCVAILSDAPQTSIVLGLCDFYFAAEGRMCRATPSKKFATGTWEGTRLLIEYLKNRICVGNCSMMIRTEVLRSRGGLPTDLPTWGADVAAWAPLLMKGAAGFVNETCATYTVHHANESTNLGLEGQLHGDSELTNYIIAMAEQLVEDPHMRRRLQLEARLFLAGRVVFNLAQHRKRGDKLSEVLPWIWRWRREIVYVGARNPLHFVKPIALVLFPKLIADQIRRLKRICWQLLDPLRSAST